VLLGPSCFQAVLDKTLERFSQTRVNLEGSFKILTRFNLSTLQRFDYSAVGVRLRQVGIDRILLRLRSGLPSHS
jgi:hypothetical protein